MIFVTKTPAPDAAKALTKTDKRGLTELQYALWHYENVAPAIALLPPKPAKAPTFKAYGAQAVRDALTALFGPKCAYCEGVFAHVSPTDVEHYRPKKGYLDEAGKLKSPGYYWLAADWDNLLPSCAECNRDRGKFHRLKDGKLVKSKSGKGNHFPIAPGSVRAANAAGIAGEVPLLLNPCVDNPGFHLRFLTDGFVEEAKTPQEAATPKGHRSINIFGLTRHDLVQQRCQIAISLRSAMQRVFQEEASIRRHPSDPVYPVQLQTAEAELAAFDDLSKPFRALVREMVRRFNEVRSAASAFHSANADWQAEQSDANRAALSQTLVEVEKVRIAAGEESGFVEQLFASAGVPKAPV